MLHLAFAFLMEELVRAGDRTRTRWDQKRVGGRLNLLPVFQLDLGWSDPNPVEGDPYCIQ
jgi:hypothetical protein